MRGNSDQKLRTINLPHHIRRQRARRQVHAIRTRGASDVGTVVHEQSCLAAASNLSRPTYQIVKHTRGQRLLANLKQRHLSLDSSTNQPQYVRSCLRSRLTARYRINDRAWKVERHLLRTVCEGSF